jgi:(1->4)-alpha-D-glucan 1-alpha-D-glucosylmutase
LQLAEEPLRSCLGAEAPAFQEFTGILSALESFASRDVPPASAAERRSRFTALRQRLRELLNNEDAARILAESVAAIHGDRHSPASFNTMQALLAEQHYKLAYWQNVNDSINYRRFFAITELVGVRVEDPLVFDALHDSLLRLVSKEVLTGLRVDHIDGLRDPGAYLTRLQQRLARTEASASNAIASADSVAGNSRNGDAERNGAGDAGKHSPAYLLVEKILARGEMLPLDWPVSGTTGYEYLNFANDVFVDPRNARKIEEIYAAFTGKDVKFPDVLYHKKKLVMSTLLGVEMRSLGRQLGELAAEDRYARELPRTGLLEALIETTACVPAYRTYLRSLEVPAEAREFIARAVAEARERKPHLDAACFEFLRNVLLLANPAHVLPGQRESRLAFVMRWQQFTGPIVAKGMEDTALYVYHPLLSLNEVGGDPQPSTASSEQDFWNFLHARQEHWPHGMNASTTHDTKRSEDVRARINVLSEIPEEWERRLQRWSEWNARHKTQVDGQLVPDRNEEYFLYQTLLGTWPQQENDFANFLQRIQEYVVKAIREAMVHTRWSKPNEAHEKGLQTFVSAILSEETAPEFLRDLRELEKSVAYFGMLNGLGQTLLKMTAPGVPDFFQGAELWDLRLVDPDNRAPVDFARRMSALRELEAEDPVSSAGESATSAAENGRHGSQSGARKLAEQWENGNVKLFLIRKTLEYRKQHAELFADGELLPAEVRGPAAENVVAFFRRRENAWSLTVVPRWLARRTRDGALTWTGTSIVLPSGAPEEWFSVLTGGRCATHAGHGEHVLHVEELLGDFPVALLIGTGSKETS